MTLALLLLQSSPAEPLAKVIVSSMMRMIVRGDFTFRSEALGYRVDIITKDGVDESGTRGALFRIEAVNPLTGRTAKMTLAIPEGTAHAVRCNPAIATAIIWN